jgi:hypothetical protein
MLKRIFVPKREEVNGEWRRLHKEERYALYSSIISFGLSNKKETEMGSACSFHGERESAFRVLMVNTEGRRPCGKLEGLLGIRTPVFT